MNKIVNFNKYKKRVAKQVALPEHFTIDVFLVEQDDDSAELLYEVEVSDNLMDTSAGRHLVADVLWSYLLDTWEGDPERVVELLDLIDEWAQDGD